jgi:hypothetical protein
VVGLVDSEGLFERKEEKQDKVSLSWVSKETRREGNKTDLAHGALEVKRSDVLPVLLEERDQEVDGWEEGKVEREDKRARSGSGTMQDQRAEGQRTKHDVGKDLVLSHVAVSDGNTEAEDLLELELDGRLDLVDLVLQVLGVSDGGGELSGLGKTGSEQSRDLLDEGLGSEEGVVLLGELLDELLVLVELLQVVNGHVYQRQWGKGSQHRS